MKSKVYFIAVSNHDDKKATTEKFNCLLGESRLLDFVRKNEVVPVKMHFGEEGNTGFVKPEYTRCVCDGLAKKGARPVLTDTNTLYRGRRLNSKGHKALAYEHGFTEEAAGAPVVIAEGNERVDIKGKFIKQAMLAKLFCQTSSIVAISHFKGHVMSGFGGALKNLGMGCASREGKLAQHSDMSPFVRFKNCTGCGECENVCPVKAITITDNPLTSLGAGKSNINSAKCIGCSSCIAVCPHNAIDVRWERGAENIQEKMIEYAAAVLKGKKEKSAFFNFAVKITKECDCLAKDDPRIAPDVGIFASIDPVSIDKACFDLVKEASGKDVFKEAWPERDWSKQLNHARDMGIGNLDYELIKI